GRNLALSGRRSGRSEAILRETEVCETEGRDGIAIPRRGLYSTHRAPSPIGPMIPEEILVKSEDAQKMMAAAKVKAAEIGKPVCTSTLDAAGLMVRCERINNPAPKPALIAEGRARGSVLTGRASVTLVPLQERPAVANVLANRLNGRFAPM